MRGEWEHEIKGDVPSLRKAHVTPLAPLLTKKLKRRLKPIFETRIHRTSVPILKNRSRIEMALDEGEVRAGRQSAPISELELELKRGKAGDLFKLAREMGKLAPATLSLKSKSERGLRSHRRRACPGALVPRNSAHAPCAYVRWQYVFV